MGEKKQARIKVNRIVKYVGPTFAIKIGAIVYENLIAGQLLRVSQSSQNSMYRVERVIDGKYIDGIPRQYLEEQDADDADVVGADGGGGVG